MGYYLDPTNVCSRCDMYISQLEKDNETIVAIRNSIAEFLSDRVLDSVAVSGLKEHMSDYGIALEGIKSANDSDKSDCYTLKSVASMANEIIDSEEIENKMNDCELAIYDAERNAQDYLNRLGSWKSLFLGQYYMEMYSYYSGKAYGFKKEYDLWKSREEKYNEIEARTTGLFSVGKDMRGIAQRGLNAVFASFYDGGFHSDVTNTWKSELEMAYVDRLLSFTDDGKVIINIEEAEKILSKKASDISESEYHAIALAFLNASDEEMARIIQACMTKESTVDYNVVQELFGYSANHINQDYDVWKVDVDKLSEIEKSIKVMDAVYLQKLRNVKADDYTDEYKVILNQRNSLLQKESLIECIIQVSGNHEFRSEMGLERADIQITHNENNGITFTFKEFRQIGSEFAPVFSSVGKSSFTISRTAVSGGIIRNNLKKGSEILFSRFGNYSPKGEVTGFLMDQAKGEVDDIISDTAEIIVEKGGKKALGTFVGYIPVIGDIALLGIDIASEYEDTKEDAETVHKVIQDAKDAEVYSEYGCSASFVEFDMTDENKSGIFVYEGDDTSQIIDDVNRQCDMNITFDEVRYNPSGIQDELDKRIDNDPGFEEKYDSVLNGSYKH